MSGGFNNPIIGGGGALVYPSIHSPNFSTGVSGWTINKDGSVEFNNGIFRGTVTAGAFEGTDFEINTDGAFFYNGTPALGNLVGSITPTAASGIDRFGNVYQGNIATYANDGSFGQMTNGGLIVAPNGIASGLHAAIFSIPGAGASGAPSLGINAPSNRNEAGHNSQALIVLQGESQDGTALAQVLIVKAQTGSATAAFQTNALLEVQGSITANQITAIVGGVAETWHNAPLKTHWGTASGFQQPQYRKNPDGTVSIRGRAEFTSNGTVGLTSGSVIFTLPTGYVPANPQGWACSCFGTINTLPTTRVPSIVVGQTGPGDVTVYEVSSPVTNGTQADIELTGTFSVEA